MVQHQEALIGPAGTDLDVLVRAQRGDVVGRQLLDQIDFAVFKRGDGAVGIRQVQPLDAIEIALLAAGQAARRFAARHVVRVAHEHRLVAGHPFIALEDEGSAAHHFGQWRSRRHFGQPLRQDHRWKARGFGQRVEHHAERLVQREREAAGVDRFPLGADGGHGATDAVACRPALQRCDDVRRRHRVAVGELESRAQCEAPLLAVLRGRVLLHHLRLRLAGGILREQRVVDHVAEVARDVGRGEGRIEDLQIGMGHDLERLGLCQRREAGTGQYQGAQCGEGCERASFHL